MYDISRLVDAHVHPHDSSTYKDEIDVIPDLQCSKICVMSSNISNQDKTTELFNAYPNKVIPAYGIHPWFCHQISLDGKTKEDHYTTLFTSDNSTTQDCETLKRLMDFLPEPVSIKIFIDQLRSYLLSNPKSFVGEVGLDKSFRIPDFAEQDIGNCTADNNGQKLTRLKTPIQHQLKILEAQLDLAIELGRCVSFHCVQAQGLVLQLLDRYFSTKPSSSSTSKKPPISKYALKEREKCRICLHSFLGSTDTFKQIQRAHSNVYFSFSSILGARSPRTAELIKVTRDDRILVETDWHSANSIDDKLRDVTMEIAQAKGWSFSDAVDTIESNWMAFYNE